MSIQDDVNNFNSSNTASDFVLLAAQIDNCTTNRSVRVPTASCLPDLACGTVAPGTIIFVDDICVPVVAQIGCWSGLDNRELRNDFSVGLVWAWGYNGTGQLGDGTTTGRSSPVRVIGGFTDWCQVSAGDFHTAAVRTNGTVWAWGYNSFGQLGDNTITGKTSPVSVIGGFTDWCQVSAGQRHTAAVRTNGTLWVWGGNNYGRLGDGTTISRSSPVSVIGGFTDWCQVSAGRSHTAAVRQNGTLWAWGCGGLGRLGDNTIINKSSPISVIGGFTDWCQVSTGDSHTAAVRTNGTLWAWGYNNRGQLGDGTLTSKRSPVSVIGGFTDWCQVSAGSGHTAAVRNIP
jgi:alpha-tubulin suppressor-like RCC1 family protein